MLKFLRLASGPIRITLARANAHGYHQVMTNIFFILLIVFLVLTVGTLLVGVFAMGKGGDFNKKNSNKLMRYRILFQAGAVLSFVLFWMTRSS